MINRYWNCSCIYTQYCSGNDVRGDCRAWEEKPLVHEKKESEWRKKTLVIITENREKNWEEKVSEGCEQSKMANVCMGKVEDFLQGRLFLWAWRGDFSFETHFSGQKTNYVPHAFVLFWQRLVEGPLQPSWVSLHYKATWEGSSCHWKKRIPLEMFQWWR